MIYTLDNTRADAVVFLDDVLQTSAILADTHNGVIVRYKLPIQVVGDEIATEVVHGAVRVTGLLLTEVQARDFGVFLG